MLKKILNASWNVYEDTSLTIKKSERGQLFKTKTIDGLKVVVYWGQKGKRNQVSDYINTIYPVIK